MTPQERFAEDYAMPLEQVQRLVRLAKRAGQANEHYSNGDPTDNLNYNPDDKNARAKFWAGRVDEITADISKLVTPYGFTAVVYTGLGPTLKRGEQFVEVPY